MKVGWGLIHQPNSLWVRVLRGKYGCGNRIVPIVQKCSRESLAWRGIRSTWDHLLSGCSWRVGHGTSIRFCKDPWIMSGHVLQLLATGPIPVNDLELPLSDFYETGNGWQVSRFSTLLPPDTVQEILMFHSIHVDGGRDEVMWDGTPSGSFTTKSAYDLICNNQQQRPEESLWKMIWRIKGPQRIRVFLWKLGNHGVLTNDIRVRRHMSTCNPCPLCLSSTEDYSHIFRDCSEVR